MARLFTATWSYSRRDLLEQCPRRYYYTYYGSNGRTAHEDPQKAQLRFLKGLCNRYERAGAILHLVIATSLRKAQEGDNWSVQRLQSWAAGILQRDRDFSRKHPDGPVASRRGSPVLLREFHYRQPDADGLYDDIRDRLLSAIESFAINRAFSAFRKGGSSPGALIEHRIRLCTLPCKVDGRVDLAYQSNGSVIIVDWKLGSSEQGDEGLQLAAYVLWAQEHFGVPLDSIRACKAFCADGSVVSYHLNCTALARGRARILQDAERMAAVDPYGRAGLSKAFSPCAQKQVCCLCSFQKACPEGRVFMGVGN